MNSRFAFRAIVLTLSLVFACGASAQAGEEGTVKALSAWQGEGQLTKVGENQALFVGGIEGIMFIEDGEGALDAAKISCPCNVEINLNDGSEVGTGRCTITDREGNQVFAEWTCTGYRLKGCKGKFILTGGTGKFQGITGESDLLVRDAIVERAADIATRTLHETSAGLAIWPELHYKIP